MLRSMFAGVSGLKAQQIKMDVIANNIANVNTVGFKSGDAYFKDMLAQNLGTPGGGSPFNKEIGYGVSVGAIDTKFLQGSLQQTSRTTDFAIEGDGMFVIAPASMFQGGQPSKVDYTDPLQVEELNYTRDGIFQWDAEGYLRTADGSYVLSSQGEPVTYADTIGNPNGTVSVESVLGVAFFLNFSGLGKTGSNNYIQTETSGVPIFGGTGEKMTDPLTGTEVKNGKIRAGFVEMSNVDLSGEFTNMIVTSRAFQANSRSITTSDEMLQELVNLKR